MYRNKKDICEMIDKFEESERYKWKQFFCTLLTNGNVYEKQISKFASENKYNPNVKDLSETLIKAKKEILDYFQNKISPEFRSDEIKLLDLLAKLMKKDKDNYDGYRIAFQELDFYY